jgi:hypothetical protein
MKAALAGLASHEPVAGPLPPTIRQVPNGSASGGWVAGLGSAGAGCSADGHAGAAAGLAAWVGCPKLDAGPLKAGLGLRRPQRLCGWAGLAIVAAAVRAYVPRSVDQSL